MNESNKPQSKPYFQLGELLRKIRTSSNKSHNEVSGAIEVSLEQIADFESGQIRPSEEVLIMLMELFDVSDAQAQRMWSLAGYDGEPEMQNLFSLDETNESNFDDIGAPEININGGPGIPPHTVSFGVSFQDPRVVYTDLAKVEINNFGVVMNFMQLSGGSESKPLAVARVGMSRDHAQKVIEMLQKTIRQFDDEQQAQHIRQIKEAQSSNISANP